MNRVSRRGDSSLVANFHVGNPDWSFLFPIHHRSHLSLAIILRPFTGPRPTLGTTSPLLASDIRHSFLPRSFAAFIRMGRDWSIHRNHLRRNHVACLQCATRSRGRTTFTLSLCYSYTSRARRGWGSYTPSWRIWVHSTTIIDYTDRFAI